jgi:uncharacterized protein
MLPNQSITFCGLLAVGFFCFSTVLGAQQAPSARMELSAKGETLKMAMGDTIFLMKKYYLALLKRSPTSNPNSSTHLSLERAHLEHLSWLAETRKTCMAGPIAAENEIKDIVIFNTATYEEAERLMRMDPAVKAGRIVYEILPWWGPIGGRLW